MAKFTVFFQDKPIHSYLFYKGVIHIGRDETNDIVLDSLAVAPAHAAVVIRAKGYIIKQLNDEFPLKINNEERKEWALDNGDKITIGKHSLHFQIEEKISFSQQAVAAATPRIADSVKPQFVSIVSLPSAGLQILDGEHIGRIIPLKKAMTRLGHGCKELAIISKRHDGYYLSPLVSEHFMTLNEKPVKEAAVKLNDKDLVVVDRIPMKFFIG